MLLIGRRPGRRPCVDLWGGYASLRNVSRCGVTLLFCAARAIAILNLKCSHRVDARLSRKHHHSVRFNFHIPLDKGAYMMSLAPRFAVISLAILVAGCSRADSGLCQGTDITIGILLDLGLFVSSPDFGVGSPANNPAPLARLVDAKRVAATGDRQLCSATLVVPIGRLDLLKSLNGGGWANEPVLMSSEMIAGYHGKPAPYDRKTRQYSVGVNDDAPYAAMKLALSLPDTPEVNPLDTFEFPIEYSLERLSAIPRGPVSWGWSVSGQTPWYEAGKILADYKERGLIAPFTFADRHNLGLPLDAPAPDWWGDN